MQDIKLQLICGRSSDISQ